MGQRTERCKYNSDGSLKYKSLYTYDDHGNTIEENRRGDDGRLFYKFSYEYDAKKNITMRTKYKSDGSVYGAKMTYNYRYDDIGNWIEKISYSDSVPKYIQKREFEYY